MGRSDQSIFTDIHDSIKELNGSFNKIFMTIHLILMMILIVILSEYHSELNEIKTSLNDDKVLSKLINSKDERVVIVLTLAYN